MRASQSNLWLSVTMGLCFSCALAISDEPSVLHQLRPPDWGEILGDESVIKTAQSHEELPTPASSFASKVSQMYVSGAQTQNVTALMYTNDTLKRQVSVVNQAYLGIYNVSQNTFQCENTGYLDINGVCRDLDSARYANLWQVLPACKMVGTTTVPFYNR